jgi:membrane fusion protein (multidrug efflux system)
MSGSANYKAQLTHVAIGLAGRVTPSRNRDQRYGASIAPASGCSSACYPDNATGNFTKVVQRIPVKLRISCDNPLAGKLRPGMSVIATILTDTTPPPP